MSTVKKFFMLGLVVLIIVATGAIATAEEGELRIGWSEQILTLDPQNHFDVIYWGAMINVLEPLVFTDENGTLQPMLAESWTRLDDVTWEFKLREGVKFHNGEPFNAEAVKYTYDRIVSPDVIQSFMWAPTETDGIERVEVVDDYTVRFITPAPFGVLVSNMPLTFIMPPEASEGGEFGIGTGPFKVVDYGIQEGLFLEANPEYWGGPPKLAKAAFIPILEYATRLAALRAGDVDVIVDPPVEEIEALQNEGFKIATAKSNNDTAIAVGRGPSKQNVAPWNNPKFIEAITYAVDRQTLVDSLFMDEQAHVATSILAPGIFGYCEQEPIERDLERAKAALAEAGVEEGLEASFIVPAGFKPKSTEVAQAIAGQLAEIGLQVQVTPVEPSAAWPILNSSDFDFFFESYGTMTLDADFNLYKNFHPCCNREGTDTAEVTALLEEARVSSDPEVRGPLYCEIQKKLWNGVSRRIPLFNYIFVYAYSPKVQNWQPRPDAMMPLHDVSVDP